MTIRANAIQAAASSAQLYRLNQLRWLEIAEEPRNEPIPRDVVKELLSKAVEQGLWVPEPRAREKERKRK